MDQRRARITVGIFAGGQGARMGGRDKAALPAPDTGEALVDRLVRLAEQLEAPVVLVGGALRQGRTQLFDLPGAPGPLGGLAALLSHVGSGAAIACACDLPRVSAALLERLASEQLDALVLAPRDPATGKWQPLFARYDSTRMQPLVQAAIASGTRSIQALLQDLPEGAVVELALDAEERALLDDWDHPSDAHRTGARGFFALEGPVLFAHRGASLEHVENTQPAFEAALALGADVIESDVHVTRDGHPVLSHDPDGARVAGESKMIADCALAEVQRWDLARARGVSGPLRMPVLADMLAQLPGVVWNLDIKHHDERILPRVLSVIAEQRAEPRVLLTSFSSGITRELRGLGYAGPVGLGRAEAVALVFAPLRLVSANAVQRMAAGLVEGARLQIPTAFSGMPLDRKALIEKLALLRVPVDYWVINALPEAERLLSLGALGIVTDDTRAMARLFARSPLTAAWRERHPELAAK